MPDSVNMIKPFAFKQATVNKIPASLTCIGQEAFRECCSIRENSTVDGFEFPNTVKRIEQFSFSDAIIPNRVIIPSSVRYISCVAFEPLAQYDNYIRAMFFSGMGAANWNIESAKWLTTNSEFDDTDSNYRYHSGEQVILKWSSFSYLHSEIEEQDLANRFNGKNALKNVRAWFKRE